MKSKPLPLKWVTGGDPSSHSRFGPSRTFDTDVKSYNEIQAFHRCNGGQEAPPSSHSRFGTDVKSYKDYRCLKVNKGRVLISRALVILGVILFIFFPITVLFSKYLYYRTLENKLTNIEQEISLLRKENMRLKNEIAMLYSPERIETLARERLGLTKSKELAFRVADTVPPLPISPSAALPGSSRSSAQQPRLSDKKDRSENLSNNEGTSHASKEQEESFWLERLFRRVYNKLRAIF